MSERILVPVDGSDCSQRALDAACGLADAVGASLVLCYVVDFGKAASMTAGEAQLVQGCLDALRCEGEDILTAAGERAHAKVAQIESQMRQGSDVAREITQAASDTRASWIVMGSHGRTGVSRLLLGSVAEGVLRKADVPVMIVHSNAASTARSSS